MCANITSSSNSRTFDPTAVPPRWLDCPRKSVIIANKFVAFKTPLDERYKEKIDARQRWTCGMLINTIRQERRNLGLVINLTNTDRFYKSDVVFKVKQIRYEKIRCRGHGETPGDEQIERFIQLCNEFSKTNHDDIIGVHCTHGFNRTGFLICAYLHREHNMNIDAAIDVFAKARPTGIYKQDYLNELLRRYGDGNSTNITAPPRPEWCLTNSDDDDEPNERPVGGGGMKRARNDHGFEQSNRRRRPETRNANPQFTVSLPGVTPVCEPSAMTTIQRKCQQMCEWHRDFPGSQPISMDINNHTTIVQSPYMVSWKADGTRYMMLIEDKHKIYMFDRNNNVFEISHLEFPKDAEYTSHLTNTLVDGELVIDNVNGSKVPSYLIYDIIMYENEDVGKRPFRDRLDFIRRSIVDIRNKAISRNFIDRSRDPFLIQNKRFWDLSDVSELDPEFRAQIAHEVDGLIFQPELDPYKTGRSPRVLKWKSDNTIDFFLKIHQYNPGIGQLPEKKAFLYVHDMEPFQMPYTPKLRQFDNQIIECSYRDGQWRFLRHRTDKSLPNGREAALGAIEAIKHPVTIEMLRSLIAENSNHHINRESSI